LVTRAFHAIIIAFALILLVTPLSYAQSDEANDSAVLRFTAVEVSPEQLVSGGIATATFTILDPTGEPVSGLRPTATLREPSSAYDESPPTPALVLVGQELETSGAYEVSIALNEPGRWWIELRVENEEGQRGRHDHFAVVLDETEPEHNGSSEPLFIRGEEWESFYRIDPETGSVSTIVGGDLFKVTDEWWAVSSTLERRGSVSRDYGGTWRLRFEIRDALNDEFIQTVEAGEIRANVYAGSDNEPAIATSIAIDPEDGTIFIYWARQLGQGWIGTVARANPETGELEERRIVNGAIASNGFWAELYLIDQNQVALVEQVVQFASIRGYRLTVFDRENLEIVAQFRNPEARNHPLTHCVLSYPGPIGAVDLAPGHRYALCSPPGTGSDVVLVVWDTRTGEPIHTIDLDRIAAGGAQFVDGAASPDGRFFYAVNTRTLEIVEIDLLAGAITREAELRTDETDASTLDRLFDWFFGSTPSNDNVANAIESAVTISSDGDLLYIISQPDEEDATVVGVDTDTLEVTRNLTTGDQLNGIIATQDGGLALIEHDRTGDSGDSVTILDRDGRTQLTFLLPGRSDMLGSHR
jgi:hypothetical protein